METLNRVSGLNLTAIAPLIGRSQTDADPAKPANQAPIAMSGAVVSTSYLSDFANTATRPVQVIGPDEFAHTGMGTDLADYNGPIGRLYCAEMKFRY